MASGRPDLERRFALQCACSEITVYAVQESVFLSPSWGPTAGLVLGAQDRLRGGA